MNVIYYLIFIYEIWTLFSIQSQDPQYWLRIYTPTSKTLQWIAFPDTMNGWAVGDSGVIIHTSDAGNNWVLQNSTVDYLIQDVYFLNKNTGWGIANDFQFHGTTILKTTNGGNIWTHTRYPDTTFVLNTIYFLDSLNGYIGGYHGVILKTTDGGNIWTRASMDTNYYNFHPIRRFDFYSMQYGLACGGIMDAGGPIWRTTDGGWTWNVRDTAAEPINDLIYFDSAFIMGTGGDAKLGVSYVKSTDMGLTWKEFILSFFGIGKALAKRTYAELWIPLGFTQKWAYSLDSGNTWALYPVVDSQAVNAACFFDEYHGWASGSNGAIYKYNQDMIGISNERQVVPRAFNLLQNYPNPFNPSTSITYEISKASRVKIIVYDVVGREIKVLVDEFKIPGRYMISFDGSGLSSGIYFYRLLTLLPYADEITYQATRKMVLLK